MGTHSLGGVVETGTAARNSSVSYPSSCNLCRALIRSKRSSAWEAVSGLLVLPSRITKKMSTLQQKEKCLAHSKQRRRQTHVDEGTSGTLNCCPPGVLHPITSPQCTSAWQISTRCSSVGGSTPGGHFHDKASKSSEPLIE